MSGDYDLDKRSIRRSFDRAASGYDGAAVLQREVCDRMLERLDFIRHRPDVVLDAGSGTGYAEAGLRERYPQATAIALDLAPSMLATARSRTPKWRRALGLAGGGFRYVCGDIEALPLRAGSVGLAFSNLALQWMPDLRHAFGEFRRVLAPGGLLMFSTFGPDTLKELREAFSRADPQPHVNRFVDMHDVGDALLASGFADPVIDMEYITMTYTDVRSLMRELKAIGAHNVTRGRTRGLTGRRLLAEVERQYETLRADGRLPATFEVVYGHAWKPLEARRTAEGHAVVKLHFPRRTGGGA